MGTKAHCRRPLFDTWGANANIGFLKVGGTKKRKKDNEGWEENESTTMQIKAFFEDQTRNESKTKLKYWPM